MKGTGPGLEQGDMAPDFEVPSTRGGSVRLSSLKGRNVVLYFYPKDDTPGCTKEACSFTDNMPRFRDLDAVVVGVSRDSIDSHKKFIAKYSLGFELASDEDLAVHKLYDTWKLKNNYGKTYWGTERSTFVIGKDGRIKQVFRGVKVDGHDAEVLQALKS